MDHDVEATVLVHDGLDGGVDRLLRGGVHLHDAQVDLMLGGVLRSVFGAAGIATVDGLDAGVDGVPGIRQGASGEGAEAAAGSADDDDLPHDPVPSWG